MPPLSHATLPLPAVLYLVGSEGGSDEFAANNRTGVAFVHMFDVKSSAWTPLLQYLSDVSLPLLTGAAMLQASRHRLTMLWLRCLAAINLSCTDLLPQMRLNMLLCGSMT